MQRVRLQGDDLTKFSLDCEGGYIKLLFTSEGSTDLSTLSEGDKPLMRTYTVRRFDPDALMIELDLVRHITTDALCGFGARWAADVKVGDNVNVFGPGLRSELNKEADWFFMTADMTALPALTKELIHLPADAKGYAVIKVLEEQDIQTIPAPEGVQVIWLTAEQSLAEKARELAWLEGQVSVWSACEFSSMRELRTYFRNEKEVDREFIYISSYWKQGVTEDGHKVIKRQDAEEQEAEENGE
ncbi:siderophore-interacting protein [Vibrio sp. SS-MA-C1-2]|nr:siderophore-interacting protein [Vibrio sp. SS-MA-C1-2]